MRDARIFLIATEGQSSEPAYFEALAAARWFDPRRVRLEVVPSDERSAPEHVLDRLDDAMARARLLPEDQSWLVADTDRWGDKKLAEVGQLALARGHRRLGRSSRARASAGQPRRAVMWGVSSMSFAWLRRTRDVSCSPRSACGRRASP